MIMVYKVIKYLVVTLPKSIWFGWGCLVWAILKSSYLEYHTGHKMPIRGLDGHLKLPISSPIGCSRFDWSVINSSYWPVEQDGWRHAFVPLTHYPTELGLGEGGGSGHQYRARQLLSASPPHPHRHSHTHISRHIIPNAHSQSDAHKHTDGSSRSARLVLEKSKLHLPEKVLTTKTMEILCVEILTPCVCVCVLETLQESCWDWTLHLWLWHDIHFPHFPLAYGGYGA